MTFPPRTGLYLLSSFSEPIASVPYKASYKLPHLAFAAFKAYLALEIGTTSWGPGVFAWFESESHARSLLRNLPEGIELMALTSAFDQPRMMTCQ